MICFEELENGFLQLIQNRKEKNLPIEIVNWIDSKEYSEPQRLYAMTKLIRKYSFFGQNSQNELKRIKTFLPIASYESFQNLLEKTISRIKSKKSEQWTVLYIGDFDPMFWPLAYSHKPKCFLPIDKKQKSIVEVIIESQIDSEDPSGIDPSNLMIITSTEVYPHLNSLLKKYPILNDNIIKMPFSMNPVSAMTYIAWRLDQKIGGDAIIRFINMDKLILQPYSFNALLSQSANFAKLTNALINLQVVDLKDVHKEPLISVCENELLNNHYHYEKQTGCDLWVIRMSLMKDLIKTYYPQIDAIFLKYANQLDNPKQIVELCEELKNPLWDDFSMDKLVEKINSEENLYHNVFSAYFEKNVIRSVSNIADLCPQNNQMMSENIVIKGNEENVCFSPLSFGNIVFTSDDVKIIVGEEVDHLIVVYEKETHSVLIMPYENVNRVGQIYQTIKNQGSILLFPYFLGKSVPKFADTFDPRFDMDQNLYNSHAIFKMDCANCAFFTQEGFIAGIGLNHFNVLWQDHCIRIEKK